MTRKYKLLHEKCFDTVHVWISVNKIDVINVKMFSLQVMSENKKLFRVVSKESVKHINQSHN